MPSMMQQLQPSSSSLRLLSPICHPPKFRVHHVTYCSSSNGLLLLSSSSSSSSSSHATTTTAISTTNTKSISTTALKRPTRDPLSLSLSHHRPSPSPPFQKHQQIQQIQHQQTRSAHHASEGRANRGARGAGKRLGAKKSALAPVVPGNIIFRQRGTQWFPGENCGIGRDHTIFAREKGFVVYYRIPWKNTRGERKMIGVVFERGQTLPLRPGQQRRRRLGLLGRQRAAVVGMAEDDVAAATLGEGEGGVLEPDVDADKASVAATIVSAKAATTTRTKKPKITIPPPPEIGKMPGLPSNIRSSRIPPSELTLKQGYMYRESNASIGRSADRAGLSARHPMSRTKYLRWRKQKEHQSKQSRLVALAASSSAKAAKKDKGKRKGKAKKKDSS